MARTLNPFNVAIRTLCDETGGTITHAEARPKLVKMGFAVADEPGIASDDYRHFKEVASKFYDNAPRDSQMLAVQEKVLAKLQLTPAKAKAVLAEIGLRATFFAEGNNFNVVKANWKNCASPSVKPKEKPTATARAARKAGAAVKRGVGRPKGSKNKVKEVPVVLVGTPAKRGPGRPRTAPPITLVGNTGDTVERLRKLGGVAAVQKMVEINRATQAAANAQAAELEGLLKEFTVLQESVKAVA